MCPEGFWDIHSQAGSVFKNSGGQSSEQPDLTWKLVQLWVGGWTLWPLGLPSSLFFFLLWFCLPSRPPGTRGAGFEVCGFFGWLTTSSFALLESAFRCCPVTPVDCVHHGHCLQGVMAAFLRAVQVPSYECNWVGINQRFQTYFYEVLLAVVISSSARGYKWMS